MNSVIEWINTEIINEGDNKINVSDVEEIRDFALLWNLFENICCDKFASMDKINNIIDYKIDNFCKEDEIFKTTYEYFYDRYQNLSRFRALNLRKSEKELITKVLNNHYNDENNILKFIMAIIYRYRNNLFHGEKNMRYIRLQKENFNIANNFLMYFIEKCRQKVW